MKLGLRLYDALAGSRIQAEAERELAQRARHEVHASQERARALIRELAGEPGPHVALGETTWAHPAPVRIPLEFLAKAHSIMTGGTGAGKTMAALALIGAILEHRQEAVSFGVLDAKGELFDRTLYLIARALARLPEAEGRALRERLVIVDFASPGAVSSYNIAHPWATADLDFFATSRVEMLQELLPSGDGLSLRGSSIVKHVLKLLADRGVPFGYFDHVLASEKFRARLLEGCRDGELKEYFHLHLPQEGRAAIAAVRARIVSALLSSASLKLALSGTDAPDLRALQDTGKIVLINCAGPNIPRATARTLQALFLSDIRQAVFARRTTTPYLWVCDEAQTFFRTRQLRENMTDLLTMSRSFGSFFLYLTQNLATAVQDADMLETLHANIRWSLSLRGTAKDSQFLRPALPVTGRREKPRLTPYGPTQCYTPNEERQLVMEEVAHLPDRVGWLWLKSRTGEALPIRTRAIELPGGDAFRATVERIRNDAGIGARLEREAYLDRMAEFDAERRVSDDPPIDDALAKEYAKDERTRRAR